jgi:hypothetical protein
VSSDNDTRPVDRRLQFAQPIRWTTRCAKCGQPIGIHGSRWQMLRGVKQRLGRCCQAPA